MIGNSRIGGNWGDEDRFIVGSMPLGKTGDTFQLLFVVEENHFKVECLNVSAVWPSGSEHRFYVGHDRKVDASTPTEASLLRPWIRYFTIIISAWWNPKSSKLKKSAAKFKPKTRKQGQLLSECGFVLCIAPPSLSRDSRIKMKKPINVSLNRCLRKDSTNLFLTVSLQ